MNLLKLLNESFDSKYLTESKQDELNFEEKFGRELTDQFLNLRKKLKSPENDFYYWIKNKSTEELSDFLSSYQSKEQTKKENKSKGSKLLFNKDEVKIYFITTYEAAQLYGKGTTWCITGRYQGHEERGKEYFNDYIEEYDLDGGYYFVIDPNSPQGKYCVLKKKDGKINSIWNAEDYSISEKEFIQDCPIGAEYFGIKDWSKKTYYWDGESKLPKSVVNVIIKDSVTILKDVAFYGYSSLQSITIPDSVTEIGRYTFYGCSSLQSIVIPNSVIEIGKGAFAYCISLQSINIPNSVTEIDIGVFSDCESLQSIVIPNSIIEIGWSAFSGCTSLQSITIPDSVIEIGASAFSGCKSLQSITIPNSVTEIGARAFSRCPDLTIRCHKNSYAEKYAIDNDIDYKIIK